MNQYMILYINTDDYGLSEIMGYVDDKQSAVDLLIHSAHYENYNGILYQYKRPSEDFNCCFYELYNHVYTNNYLNDYDRYEIIELHTPQ